MTFLICQILSGFPGPVSLEFAIIDATAFLTANLQSVRPGAIYVKVAFLLPFLAHSTALLLNAPDRAMAVLVSVIFPHFLSFWHNRQSI